MTHNIPLNILCSYAFLQKNKPFTESFFSLSKSGVANIMIDSGAFTAFTTGRKIEIEDYCEFLHQYGHLAEKYVMLDCVGNEKKTKENYEYMVKQGLKPMFTCTMYDKDFDFIRDTLSVNENICVAGGATAKNEWIKYRFQKIFNETKGKAKMHGLAYVLYPEMLRLNLASVDSSSIFQSGQMYGILQTFDEVKGLKSVAYKEVYKGKKLSKELVEQLDILGITPKMFLDKNNMRGGESIPTLCDIYTHIKMQRYCYRKGLRYFFAIISRNQLRAVQVVNENFNNITYDKFKNYLK